MITSATYPCGVVTHVGITVHVVLDPGFTWNTPMSDSPTVDVVNVRRLVTGRLEADLQAVSVGQATVSAAGSVRCAPGQPCPALARLWAVHVTVEAK